MSLGISGLRRESDRALSDLNSNDKRLETNKKMREVYRMKKDVTKGAKISSGVCPSDEHTLTCLSCSSYA